MGRVHSVRRLCIGPRPIYKSIKHRIRIGEVASRYVNSEFSEDPVVKEKIAELYDRAQTKKSSSESLFKLIDQEERVALAREVGGGHLYLSVRKRVNELEAEMAFNIWKQNCWRSMIADFRRRLKYYNS